MNKVHQKVRVAICNQYTMFREGIKALLGPESLIEIVGEARTARDAIEQARRLDPDVILLDAAPPDLSGSEATRRIRGANPRVKVLLLTMWEDEALIASCLRAGASGHIPSSAQLAHLQDAIDAVCRPRHQRGRRAA